MSPTTTISELSRQYSFTITFTAILIYHEMCSKRMGPTYAIHRTTRMLMKPNHCNKR